MRGKETSPYYTDQTLVVKLIEHASPNGKMPTTMILLLVKHWGYILPATNKKDKQNMIAIAAE
jgi:hypothetical protein